MKNWVLHARGKLRGDVVEPLCGQVTGYGSKGCDQALIGRAVVTCKKCLRMMSAPPPRERLCAACELPARGRRRRCPCNAMLCRGCWNVTPTAVSHPAVRHIICRARAVAVRLRRLALRMPVPRG